MIKNVKIVKIVEFFYNFLMGFLIGISIVFGYKEFVVGNYLPMLLYVIIATLAATQIAILRFQK